MTEIISLIKSLLAWISAGCDLNLYYYKEILDTPFKFLLYGNTISDYTHEVTKMNSLLVGIYDVVFPVAAILIVLAFMMKLVEFIMLEQLSYEILAKHIIYVLVLLIILGNGCHFVGVLFEIVDPIANDYFVSITSEVTGSDFLGNVLSLLGFEDGGDFNPWSAITTLVFPETAILSVIYYLAGVVLSFILSVIIACVLTYHALVRASKLGIYIVLMPFAVSDLYTNGTNSKLVPYSKKLIALLLQEYVILFDMAILMSLFTDCGLFSQLIMFFLIIQSIGGSDGASKRLLGVS